MERFAFRINGALKQNLYQTCRLCGIDNPDMVNILAESSAEEGDVNLTQKIEACIGFTILKNDKMPQSACALCVDKVNDFYEYREMCHTTNTQMRKLLGLKAEKLKKDIPLNNDASPAVKSIIIDKRGRKRQSLETSVPEDPALQVLSAIIDDKPDLKKVRLMKNCTKILLSDGRVVEAGVSVKNLCVICNQKFNTSTQLKHHLNIIHVPNIPRYSCTSCNEAIDKAVDIKNHQLWHKASRTPYSCPLCKKTPSTSYAYSRHMKDHNIELSSKRTVQDCDCRQCGKRFETIFLFNTHECAFQLGKCVGCRRPFKTKTDHMRHAATCAPVFVEYAKELEPVKTETELPGEGKDQGYPNVNDPNGGELLSDMSKKKKNGKKKNLDNNLKRVGDLLHATMDALVSIKHEPEVNIGNDGIPTATDTNANEMSNNLDIENRPKDQNEITMAIKQERLDDDDIPIGQECENIELNIKKELISNTDVDAREHIENKLPLPRIKIKKEHGTLNSSLVGDNSNIETPRKKQRINQEYTGEIGDLQHNLYGIRIKQEVLDVHAEMQNYSGFNEIPVNMETNVMTSIPLPQIQISCVSGGVNFTDASESYDKDAETQDVKPNVDELNRLMRLSQSQNESQISKDNHQLNSNKRRAFNPHFHNVAIKQEPINRGYSDEIHQEYPEKSERPKKTFFSGTVRNPAYGRVKIKQEKDIIDDSLPMSTLPTTSIENIEVQCIATIKEEKLNENENNANVTRTSDNNIESYIDEVHENTDDMSKEQSQLLSENPESAVEASQCDETKKTEATIDEPENQINAVHPDNSEHIDAKCDESKDETEAYVAVLESAQESIQGTISVPKEFTSSNPPPAENFPICTKAVAIDEMSEEEQNVLNHEVAEQSSTEEGLTSLVESRDSCTSPLQVQQTTTDCKSNAETTDNLVNETMDAVMGYRQSTISDFVDLMDNSNMNEIAENHNNANIERELLEELPQLINNASDIAEATATPEEESIETTI